MSEKKKLKSLLKETLVEVIEQKEGLFHNIIEEVIEAIAMTNAIKAGESSESISRDEIFKIIGGRS